ncbi:charged multivesicular body protein 7 [Drosophila sulfurigaster albostrigata]|uniref:charged multivesicular body protein 7 n=1 Tax=Drosophila sulfurigaster albostrigata TaxID=89887 RepID=UPI002D21C25D|nr:charged multivesicular body protein 7 [Drosophila sulfurigaster albostrigata]
MQTSNQEMEKNNNPRKFEFPPVWEENGKMKELLAAFHSRHISPGNYDAKMIFWTDLIKRYCQHYAKANFSLRELQLQFMRGEQIPACLETVIADMAQRKQIRLRSEYEYDPVNSWSGWLVNSFVKRPLSQSWLKLKHSIVAEDMGARSLVEWIHVDVIQHLCSELETKVLQKNRGKLLHFEGFKSICKNCEMDIHEICLPLCLITLQVRRLIAIEFKIERQTKSIHLIKIPANDHDSPIISEKDHAMHNLDMTRVGLLKQLEELEEEIKVNDTKARQYVKENKRQLAKTYLRKRRLLEKNHERRSIALHNIETLLSNVDEAQNTGVVLDAYKIGSKTLQNVLNESGLKYDNVDEVLADVRDTIDQHREVQDALSNSNADGAFVDEDDLEKELKELLGEKEAVLPNISFSNNNKPEIVIDDAELLAMLDNLEVADETISHASFRTKESA